MHDIIDIDTGAVVVGERTIEQMGEAILDLVIQVASGEVRTKAEAESAGRFHSLEARRLALTADTNTRISGSTEKYAVITGGGSGIGQAIAFKFAAQGAAVRILDVNESAATETCQQITAAGGRASAHLCDVTNPASVSATFNDLFSAERVDILINNAGISHIGTVETTTPEDFDRVVRVNIKGFYNCMRAIVGHMKDSGGGIIVNMASIAGSSGLADRFAYSTSKGAVIAMTYSVARDYLAHNIRCNCISPARVHTPFVDNYLQKNYPGREQRCSRNCPRPNPSEEWQSPRKLLPSRCSYARTKLHSSPAWITRSMAASSTCEVGMDLQLKDKVIVVTGGAKGIGAAIVRACAAEGAIPVIVDRDAEAGEATAEPICKAPAQIAHSSTSISPTPESCSQSVEQTLENLRPDRCPGEQCRAQRQGRPGIWKRRRNTLHRSTAIWCTTTAWRTMRCHTSSARAEQSSISAQKRR